MIDNILISISDILGPINFVLIFYALYRASKSDQIEVYLIGALINLIAFLLVFVRWINY